MFELLLEPFRVFVSQADRLYWLYWLSAYAGGMVVIVLIRREVSSIRQGLSYLFPASTYLTRSVFHDCLMAYINLIWMAGLFGSWGVLISISASSGAESWLKAHVAFLYACAGALRGNDWLWTVVLFVVSDFCMYLAHYFQHRIGWLWEFHKVHHSAEVMMPVTVYRFHPLDNLWNLGVAAIGVGIALGFIRFIIGDHSMTGNVGGGALMMMFYLFFFNLRHSHVWLAYGPVFGRIFMSPAQHQIHHSRAQRHIDKNFGFVFAFWDWIGGTLYLPYKKEALVFGLNSDDAPQYRSLLGLLWLPFERVSKKLSLQTGLPQSGLVTALVFLLALLVPLVSGDRSKTTGGESGTVFLEEMTWPEVSSAIDNGMTSIIIPTGGIEQNGPHLILGKHNAIVRYTAEQVALELGNALVAPVVAYVPEGRINPPEGHMQFAGTISVSEDLFAGVLEATARSLKQHGFKTILFLGDSGGNQLAQRKIAASLGREWAHMGLKVMSLHDYYEDNHQVEYLMDLGFYLPQIGVHAGIRDTSELMRVWPKGVRKDQLVDAVTGSVGTNGYDGAVTHSSPQLGAELLRLKIRAAVDEARAQ